LADQPPPIERSYGCTFGCGNPYDIIVISVADSTTEFLCIPCYVRMASDLVEVITNPDSEAARTVSSAAGAYDTAPMHSPPVRRRGHHAPATASDPDILAAFDSVVTADELSDEFR
jgi:hypothetical protein